ncbi:MAG: NAD-dependent epimerase/dehydratase family protein, partial [Hydrogenophaga sp.]
MKVLVTGSAGFIGAALISRLLARGNEVVGVDNLNNYYDVRLKVARLETNRGQLGYTEIQADLADTATLERIFSEMRPNRVVNLAAQAGVRYSLQNPQAYLSSNVVGFGNVLECCRRYDVEHLVFASSSSVYGANTKMPFSVSDNVDHPVSLYAATKKANELMAHSYTHLYGLPCTGLRFFTVYGPWGRPDMAYYSFTRKILAGKPIDVFNHGKMQRDFTYIDDVIEGVMAVIDHIPAPNPLWSGDAPDPATSYAPYRIYNI